MTGEAESSSFAVVTPDTFTTESIACYFETIGAEREPGFELQASCKIDGDSTLEAITVTTPESGGVIVAMGSVAMAWGPLFRCPGTEELFEPLVLPV